MRRGLTHLTIAIFATAALSPSVASAHGAFAYGVNGAVAVNGLAAGYTYNFSSAEEARNSAMTQCLGYQDAPPDTRSKCKIARTFENQCLGISIDPNAGTEGFGWSVSDTSEEAGRNALRMCRDTDGKHMADCAAATIKCDITK